MPTNTAHAMHICLLTNQELDDPELASYDWPNDPRPFMPEARWHLAVLEDKVESVRQIKQLIRDGADGEPFDVFFNLCDGAADQPDLPGIEVVRAMERAGVAFTGATSRCYEPTRMKMKRVCRQLGIATPAHVIARNMKDVNRAARTLEFPLFVKHHNSYASVDISRRSKVNTLEGLRIQARKIISRHGAAMIEEFIEGTECTVLVSEHPDGRRKPIVYTPVQYEFPDGDTFKHSDLKWKTYQKLRTAPVTDPMLKARLQDETGRFFTAMDFAGFGRCDVRVDEAGTTWMLEINANCGVYYEPEAAGSADFCISLDPEGHQGFTRRLVEAALARQRRRARSPVGAS